MHGGGGDVEEGTHHHHHEGSATVEDAHIVSIFDIYLCTLVLILNATKGGGGNPQTCNEGGGGCLLPTPRKFFSMFEKKEGRFTLRG